MDRVVEVARDRLSLEESLHCVEPFFIWGTVVYNVFRMGD